MDETRCNTKTIKLASGGGTLTLACSNLFAMDSEDRRFVLGLLKLLEEYELDAREQGAS